MLHEVPEAPDSPVFEQGNTIGKDARGWRRAKFLGRFRLFFRFDLRSKVIIYEGSMTRRRCVLVGRTAIRTWSFAACCLPVIHPMPGINFLLPASFR